MVKETWGFLGARSRRAALLPLSFYNQRFVRHRPCRGPGSAAPDELAEPGEELVEVPGGGRVGHGDHGQVEGRVDTHGVPVAATGAVVLDEAGVTAGVGGAAEPADAMVAGLADMADATH